MFPDSDLHAPARAFVCALGAHHGETAPHCERVAKIAVRLARELNLAPSRTHDLYYGALLHDAGKLCVPQSILHKPFGVRLTDGEWEELRAHTYLGAQMLNRCGFPLGVLEVVAQHHERYDGTGYPHGLKGVRITPEARITAVADAYDAITRDRCYRRGEPDAVARHEITCHAGTQFDPKVVEAFLRISADELSAITSH